LLAASIEFFIDCILSVAAWILVQMVVPFFTLSDDWQQDVITSYYTGGKNPLYAHLNIWGAQQILTSEQPSCSIFTTTLPLPIDWLKHNYNSHVIM
jgi:hypothetical protein